MTKVRTIFCILSVLVGLPHAALAALSSTETGSSRAFQNALKSDKAFDIYTNKTGFSLSGSLFSGRASGVENAGGQSIASTFDNAVELEHDQRVYALLIDGSYDFNLDLGNDLPIRPYVKGGVGMAVSDGQEDASSVASSQNNTAVPLFRIGGGVTYRLDEKWNLSLDYKAGFTSSQPSDRIFTGRSQEPIDLQSLNMGMHYRF